MNKHYKILIDHFDELMIALRKQKQLELNPEVIKAIRSITLARNTFKRNAIKLSANPIEIRKDTRFTLFLDLVADHV